VAAIDRLFILIMFRSPAAADAPNILDTTSAPHSQKAGTQPTA